MQLKTWKETKGLRLCDIIEMLAPYSVRLSIPMISLHMNGRKFPSPEAIDAYKGISEDSVTFDDFLELRTALRAGRSVFNQEEE